jgi:hypothetical protein
MVLSAKQHALQCACEVVCAVTALIDLQAYRTQVVDITMNDHWQLDQAEGAVVTVLVWACRPIQIGLSTVSKPVVLLVCCSAAVCCEQAGHQR